MTSLIIRNGTIINADSTFTGDILVQNGRIISVADHIDAPGSRFREIDAAGLYVLPGAIDPHVHFNLPTPAGPSSDDFHSGSIAALLGGTTSIIDFVTPYRGQSMIAALIDRLQEAEASLIDYSFHMSVTSWNSNIPNEMARCVELGIPSFKTYMAYNDTIGISYDELAYVMSAARDMNALVTVHCEDGERIKKLQQEFIDQGRITPEYHELSRPDDTETGAVIRVIERSEQTGCKVYIVHVSSAKAIDLIGRARWKGQSVYAETCPQYLLLDKEKYRSALPGSLAYVISPPLRTLNDRESLWKSISDGNIDVVATDHCPFNLSGQKDKGMNNFTRVPNGTGGVEFRLSLLHTFGVLTGRFNMNRMVEITSEMPARIFGLWPQKGAIAPGADADIVLWDPRKEHIISAKDQAQHCDHTVYEGIKTTGAPYMVILRGQIAAKEGKLLTKNLKGRFLKRHGIVNIQITNRKSQIVNPKS